MSHSRPDKEATVKYITSIADVLYWNNECEVKEFNRQEENTSILAHCEDGAKHTAQEKVRSKGRWSGGRKPLVCCYSPDETVPHSYHHTELRWSLSNNHHEAPHDGDFLAGMLLGSSHNRICFAHPTGLGTQEVQWGSVSLRVFVKGVETIFRDTELGVRSKGTSIGSSAAPNDVEGVLGSREAGGHHTLWNHFPPSRVVCADGEAVCPNCPCLQQRSTTYCTYERTFALEVHAREARLKIEEYMQDTGFKKLQFDVTLRVNADMCKCKSCDSGPTLIVVKVGM